MSERRGTPLNRVLAQTLQSSERALHQLREVLHERGRCVEGGPADHRYFPEPVPRCEPAAQRRAERAAREACAGCTVASECLAAAVATGQRHGIWGGRAPHEVITLVNARRIRYAAPEQQSA